MADTNAKISQTGASRAVDRAFNDLLIICDNPNDGAEIPNGSILSLTIHEDIFSLLPVVILTILDSGTKFDTAKSNEGYYIGKKLYIQYRPKVKLDKGDKTPPAYVQTRVVIQEISHLHNDKMPAHVYRLACCFDAMSVLTRVMPYPAKDEILPEAQISLAEGSASVIQSILGAGGLACTKEANTFDSMHWVNTRMRICQFLNKVLDHSWIEQGDALMVFTSMFGERNSEGKSENFDALAHCTSCSELMNQTSEIRFVSEAAKVREGKTSVIQYQRLSIVEAGGVSTIPNGYTHQTTTFNTDNFHMFDPFTFLDIMEFEPIDTSFIGSNMIYAPNLNVVRTTYDGIPNKQFASNPGTVESLYEFVAGKHDGGIHFMDTHEHYDVAPAHNRSVIASYFTTKIELLVNMSELDKDIVMNPNFLPRVGQKVTLDCSSDEKHANLGYSGDYIIGSVEISVMNDRQRPGAAEAIITLIGSGNYQS